MIAASGVWGLLWAGGSDVRRRSAEWWRRHVIDDDPMDDERIRWERRDHDD